MSQVKNLGEALTVLVQVAELAQSRGILSFDDAVVTKSAIDFIKELSNQVNQAEGQEELTNEPESVVDVNKTIRRSKGPKA
jgi:hypothetical protein